MSNITNLKNKNKLDFFSKFKLYTKHGIIHSTKSNYLLVIILNIKNGSHVQILFECQQISFKLILADGQTNEYRSPVRGSEYFERPYCSSDMKYSIIIFLIYYVIFFLKIFFHNLNFEFD